MSERKKPLFDKLEPQKHKGLSKPDRKEIHAWSKTSRGILQDFIDVILDFISQ